MRPKQYLDAAPPLPDYHICNLAVLAASCPPTFCVCLDDHRHAGRYNAHADGGGFSAAVSYNIRVLRTRRNLLSPLFRFLQGSKVITGDFALSSREL